MNKDELKNIVIGLFILVLCLINFFVGYGVGMSNPDHREAKELEKQIKTEELKKLRLRNEAMERALFDEETKNERTIILKPRCR